MRVLSLIPDSSPEKWRTWSRKRIAARQGQPYRLEDLPLEMAVEIEPLQIGVNVVGKRLRRAGVRAGECIRGVRPAGLKTPADNLFLAASARTGR